MTSWSCSLHHRPGCESIPVPVRPSRASAPNAFVKATPVLKHRSASFVKSRFATPPLRHAQMGAKTFALGLLRLPSYDHRGTHQHGILKCGTHNRARCPFAKASVDTTKPAVGNSQAGSVRVKKMSDYLTILVTRPAPTVRPPSRIAKRRPSSIATGWIRVTAMSTLSPGMTISVPSGSFTTPVTSVVRK